MSNQRKKFDWQQQISVRLAVIVLSATASPVVAAAGYAVNKVWNLEINQAVIQTKQNYVEKSISDMAVDIRDIKKHLMGDSKNDGREATGN